jgi:hypothetical protein
MAKRTKTEAGYRQAPLFPEEKTERCGDAAETAARSTVMKADGWLWRFATGAGWTRVCWICSASTIWLWR